MDFLAGYVVINILNLLFFNMTSFVAPWKRDNIPDYGPMSPIAIITASCSIGLVSTIIYEYSGYVDSLITRVFS